MTRHPAITTVALIAPGIFPGQNGKRVYPSSIYGYRGARQPTTELLTRLEQRFAISLSQFAFRFTYICLVLMTATTLQKIWKLYPEAPTGRNREDKLDSLLEMSLRHCRVIDIRSPRWSTFLDRNSPCPSVSLCKTCRAIASDIK